MSDLTREEVEQILKRSNHVLSLPQSSVKRAYDRSLAERDSRWALSWLTLETRVCELEEQLEYYREREKNYGFRSD